MILYIYWLKTKKALKSKKGQGMIEYVLILAFTALAVIVSLTAFGQSILNKYTEILSIF